jgi:hypothetical protein
MKEEDILKEPLVWKPHPSNKKYHQTYINGEHALLRLNNFPDDPIYTFIYYKDIDNFLIFHLDESPKSWKIEY